MKIKKIQKQLKRIFNGLFEAGDAVATLQYGGVSLPSLDVLESLISKASTAKENLEFEVNLKISKEKQNVSENHLGRKPR